MYLELSLQRICGLLNEAVNGQNKTQDALIHPYKTSLQKHHTHQLHYGSLLQEFCQCTVLGPDSQHPLQTVPWALAPLPISCKDGGDEAPPGTNLPFQPHYEQQQQPEQLSLPVAQRAMKVCACFRIKSNLSLGRGTFLRMCSMKSCGVTAARFHFNFPSTTSSHSCRGWTGRAQEKKSHKKACKKLLLISYYNFITAKFVSLKPFFPYASTALKLLTLYSFFFLNTRNVRLYWK